MEEPRRWIFIETGVHRYFDKNGTELKEGDTIAYADGRREKSYLTTENQLGTDATNPTWIESDRAVPCEYGIYPIEVPELLEACKVEMEYEQTEIHQSMNC